MGRTREGKYQKTRQMWLGPCRMGTIQVDMQKSRSHWDKNNGRTKAHRQKTLRVFREQGEEQLAHSRQYKVKAPWETRWRRQKPCCPVQLSWAWIPDWVLWTLRIAHHRVLKAFSNYRYSSNFLVEIVVFSTWPILHTHTHTSTYENGWSLSLS